MRIAVYSGSFAPLHVGHMAIMNYLTTVKDFDWVYLVISPQNPLKDSSMAASGEQRYRDAIAAVRRHPDIRVWVDNVELSMDPPHYSIRTLEALKEREPENDFTLVIGADNFVNIRKWKDYERILTEFGVEVYPRDGYDVESTRQEFSDPKYRIQFIDRPLVNVSSTQIRELLARGEDVSDLLM